MREMKDSGIKWIGVIPSAWRTARVKNVAETMQSGGTPDSSNDTFYVDIEGGIPWVAIADMSTTPYVKDTNKHISEEGRKSKNLIVFEPGRLSQTLCKPPMWCRIEAPHWRFHYDQKETHARRKCTSGENPGAAAAGEHRQHGGYPEFIQGDHCRVHGKWFGVRVG